MIGERIGRVRIDARLGRGGMGDVYRGFDEGLEREVAVKTLTEVRRLHPEAKARLLREARLLSKLDHPGICRIHDLAETSDADCLILEYIDGHTLREMLGKLTRAELLDLFAQVADALAAAHSQEIVHRDLKPENIMVTPDLRAKVLDLGIARSMLEPVRPAHGSEAPPLEKAETLVGDSRTPLWPSGDDDTALLTSRSAGPLVTTEGMLIGTVRYMSPEQARGETVSSAADMYALGVMLQEVFTGRDPYDGASGVDLIALVARAETSPADSIEDRDLAQLIDELENLDPRRRPSATEVAERLRWSLDRPQRERRQQTRRALVAAGLIAAIVATAAIGWRELRARRQVTIAQEFAAEARDITWMMRAEYLSPMHDLEPARAEVDRRQERLREQMNALGRLAEGPGALAFGQVHLALGELEAARTHLDAAWAAGVRTPEAAFARGVVLAQLYHRGVIQSRYLGADERAAEQQRLVRELRDPALEMLARGRESSSTPGAYIEGLVAMIEERYEDGLAATARLADAAPWMYEAPILEGELHLQQGQKIAFEKRDFAAETSYWEMARTSFRHATRTGRSYPTAWDRLCRVEARLAESQFATDPAQLQEADLDSAVEICQQVVALQPEIAAPHMLLAGLATFRGQLYGLRGDDPVPCFQAAQDHAQRAVELEPDNVSAHGYNAYVSYWLGDLQLRSGENPIPALRRAIDHGLAAQELSPDEPYLAVYLGDAYWLGAQWLFASGDDPVPWIERGLDALAPALAAAPDNLSLVGCKGNLMSLRGLCESSRGQEAQASLEAGAACYRRLTESSTSAIDHLSSAEAERRLAQYLVATGKEPSEAIQRAHAALDRSNELQPGEPSIHRERGATLLVEARLARREGRPTGKLLTHAILNLELGTEDPTPFWANILLGQAHLDAARWAIEDGRSPQSSIAAAREAFQSAAAEQPLWLDPKLGLARASLLEGRWRRERGLEPTDELDRAEALLGSVIEAAADDARAHGYRAELHLERARWQRGQGRPFAALCERGLAAADAALAIHPKLEIALQARDALESLHPEPSH